MRYFKMFLLGLVFGFGGCSMPWEDPIPENELTGEYNYSTESVYYDEFGAELSRKVAEGGLSFVTSISVVPYQGWSYRLEYSELTDRVLSNGNIIRTFEIPSQIVEVNNIEFLVIGLSKYEVKDSDGTVLGKFSGWVDSNDKFYFACESIDLGSKKRTVTSYTAEKR